MVLNNVVEVTWSNLKTIATNKNLKMNYETFTNSYDVYVSDGAVNWMCKVVDSDKTDFENNYKSNANKKSPLPIQISNGTYEADVTSTNRLKVDAVFGSGSTIFPTGIPRTVKVINQSVVSGVTHTILNYSGKGVCDFITANFSSNNFELILSVDGTEVYRLTPSNVNQDFKLTGNDTGGALINSHTANGIEDQYPTPFSFNTNLTVQLKNTDVNTKVIIGAFVRYRIE